MSTYVKEVNLIEVTNIIRRSYTRGEVSDRQIADVYGFLSYDEEGYANTTEAAEAAAYAFGLDHLDGATWVSPQWVYDLTILVLGDEGD